MLCARARILPAEAEAARTDAVSATQVLEDLLQAVADLAVLGGWRSDEVLHGLRKALADSGEKLGLSRDEAAARLGVSRRVLSTWSSHYVTERFGLEVVLAIRSNRDVEVPPDREREFVAAARQLARLRLVHHRLRDLMQPTQLVLERAEAMSRRVATALENTRAQPKLGSRVVSEPEDPAQPQPGHAQTNRTDVNLKLSMNDLSRSNHS